MAPSWADISSTSSGGGITHFAFLVSLTMFIKNMTILTIFAIRKFIDNKQNPQMRPSTQWRSLSRVEKEESVNIQHYLMDPNDEGIDEEGNTSIHYLSKFETISTYED
jgi:hypothetical protein